MPTRYFYDLEFIEDGRTVDLVSIGMVAEDGREYYAISNEFSHEALLANRWLVENVLPTLPFVRSSSMARSLVLDYDHPDRAAVKPRWQIANEVAGFIRGDVESSEDRAERELWAYYGAYDHVGLCQLWGRMIDLPAWVPMHTNDLMTPITQLARAGLMVERPAQTGEHNALADARWDFALWQAVNKASLKALELIEPDRE